MFFGFECLFAVLRIEPRGTTSPALSIIYSEIRSHQFAQASPKLVIPLPLLPMYLDYSVHPHTQLDKSLLGGGRKTIKAQPFQQMVLSHMESSMDKIF